MQAALEFSFPTARKAAAAAPRERRSVTFTSAPLALTFLSAHSKLYLRAGHRHSGLDTRNMHFYLDKLFVDDAIIAGQVSALAPRLVFLFASAWRNCHRQGTQYPARRKAYSSDINGIHAY